VNRQGKKRQVSQSLHRQRNRYGVDGGKHGDDARDEAKHIERNDRLQ